jgi:hypothetical protein
MRLHVVMYRGCSRLIGVQGELCLAALELTGRQGLVVNEKVLATM